MSWIPDSTGERCDCLICKRGRMYADIIKNLPKNDRRFMEGIYDKLESTETELDYNTEYVVLELEKRVRNLSDALYMEKRRGGEQ